MCSKQTSECAQNICGFARRLQYGDRGAQWEPRSEPRLTLQAGWPLVNYRGYKKTHAGKLFAETGLPARRVVGQSEVAGMISARAAADFSLTNHSAHRSVLHDILAYMCH